MEAQSEGNESTPHRSIMSVKDAKEAPKDKGRVNINGIISEGIPIAERNGASSRTRVFVAPEVNSILTPIIKAHIVGSRLKADLAPSFAPFKKKEK